MSNWTEDDYMDPEVEREADLQQRVDDLTLERDTARAERRQAIATIEALEQRIAMQKALEADGEKLRQLTGEDHGPHFIDEFEDCWNCGGEGFVANCQDEIGCVDPESGCDLCTRRCPICSTKVEA